MTVRFGYPVTLDLHGVLVVVVGGGPIAGAKVAGLAAAGAALRVVATAVSAEMTAALAGVGAVDVIERAYVPADLSGARLVLAATNDAEVDARVAADATAAGLWVNAADRREHCTFILPAIARNGPLTVAVSTDGSSPALAGRIRARAGALLTDEVVALAERLARERAAIRAAGGSTETYDWSPLIDPVLPPNDDSQASR